VDYSSIKSHFEIKEDKKRDTCTAICPSHADKEASLCMKYDSKEGKTMLKCFAGCEVVEIVEAAGLKMTDLFDKPLKDKEITIKNDITYQYKDASGNALFEKVRFEATEFKKKHFSQRRIINSSTVWGLDGGTYYETFPGGNNWSKKKRDNANTKDFLACEPVLYNLPELIEAIKQRINVYVVEGEKDAENLEKWGLIATCNFDGASRSTQTPKWRKIYNQYFKGAKVIILNDNDDPGRAHADYIAAELYGNAEYIKRPNIPGLQEKEDVSDWINAGHTKEEFIEIINNTQVYEFDDASNQSLINFNFSDVGNAERLLAVYGKNIKYNPIRCSWFIWSGKHWKADNNGKIENLSRKVIRKLQAEGESISLSGLEPEEKEKKSKLKSKIRSFVLKSEGDGRLKAMINQAKTFNAFIIKETDKNVYILNVKNGTLNLRTGLIKKHERKDFLTKLIDVEYSAKTQCPNWLEFINKIFTGDKELINYIQKSIGYSLTGDSRLQCFYILHGKGSNGKGTFMQVISKLMGPYYSTLMPESLMERTGNNEGAREDLAKLESTRFVCVNECDENKYFDENLLKRMSSGANEKFTVRRMYEKYFDLSPEFKMWMTTNSLPRIKGTDKGIWRRVRKIPFEYDFDLDENKDLNFFDEKLLPEITGILNWALEGCLKWQQEGMEVPEAVMVELEKYKSDMDPILRFIEDCCVVSETCKVRIPDLYENYIDWSHENKEYVLSSIKFSKKLADKGYKQSRIMNYRYWIGIGIADNEQPIEMCEVRDNISPFHTDKD